MKRTIFAAMIAALAVAGIAHAEQSNFDGEIIFTPTAADTYAVRTNTTTGTRTFSVTKAGLVQTGTSACGTATGAGDLCINGDLDVTGSIGLGATTLSSLIVTGATDLRGTVALGNALADLVTQTGAIIGTAAASGSPALGANECVPTVNGSVCEGATADTIETFVIYADPTVADSTLTIPNAGGTGTYAVNATTPLALSATTGMLTLGTVLESKGGTSETTYAQGDMLYASAIDTLGKLTVGTNVQSLVSNGTVPEWGTPALAATATALAADPGDCAANQFANTIAAAGTLGCASIADADVPNTITIDLATNASNLNADPSDCGANAFAQSIDSQGDLTCGAISDADVPDGITVTLAGTATALAADPADCGANAFAQSIAASGALTCSAIGDADVPNNITIDTATTAGTATALAADPADCGANNFAQSIAASGALTCAAISDADVPDGITVTLAGTATALAADPADCGANAFAQSIAASGALTCAGIADADVPNTITIDYATAAGSASQAYPGTNAANYYQCNGNIVDGETFTIAARVYEFDPSANGCGAVDECVTTGGLPTCAASVPAVAAAVNEGGMLATADGTAGVVVYKSTVGADATVTTSTSVNFVWTNATLVGGTAAATKSCAGPFSRTFTAAEDTDELAVVRLPFAIGAFNVEQHTAATGALVIAASAAAYTMAGNAIIFTGANVVATDLVVITACE